MKRLLVLLVLLLALPAAAYGQASSNPFGPLPQPPPQAPPPTETPAPVRPEDQNISRGLLFGIAGGILIAFIGIGLYISRDARRRLTDSDRRALEREREDVDLQRRRSEQAKKKAREKARAQKRARKKQRSRR